MLGYIQHEEMRSVPNKQVAPLQYSSSCSIQEISTFSWCVRGTWKIYFAHATYVVYGGTVPVPGAINAGAIAEDSWCRENN